MFVYLLLYTYEKKKPLTTSFFIISTLVRGFRLISRQFEDTHVYVCARGFAYRFALRF
jgi:hypothetical protein